MMLLADTDTVAQVFRHARTFSLHDRCDRCRFQAYFVAQKDGNELVFCAHHGNEHLLALEFLGWDVLNFTSELNEKRSVE